MKRDAGAPADLACSRKHGDSNAPPLVGLYSAIVTALYRRRRTGEGCVRTTSLLAEGFWSVKCFV